MVLVSNVLKSVRRLVRTNDAFLLISQDYKLAAEYDKSYPVIQLPNRIVVLITGIPRYNDLINVLHAVGVLFIVLCGALARIWGRQGNVAELIHPSKKVSGVDATGRPHPPNVPKIISQPDTLRALSKTIQGRDSNPKNATNIAKSWNGATLFSLEGQVTERISAGIEVTCVTCYVKGLVTSELGVASDFDIIQAITNFTEDVGEEIENVTNATLTYLENEVPEFLKNLTDHLDIDFPPLNVSFNVDIPDIPECRLHFQFDGLELYMLLDTVLSAGTTYTLNLYSSNTPIGLSIDSETFVGVIVSIDLILGVDTDIDISSGLHIKVDDGMALDLSLFSQSVSSVTFNGASFEFLPVTVQSASGTRLRVGMHAGISLESGEVIPPVSWSAGTEVLVYADLAEFTTNITAVPEGDDSGCQLRVQQAYQLALGAAAGVTIAILQETWGPDPSTKIPIFYTTLADQCAESVTRTSSIAAITTPTPTLAARAGNNMTTTTLTDAVTFTGLVCVSTGLSECPASLQSTTKVISTRTLVVTVPFGSKATFPDTTQNSILETIPFSNNIKVVAATTGSPISFVPPPPPPSSTVTAADSGGQGEKGGKPPAGKAGANTPLIIGLTVGLGVPFLAIVVSAAYLFLKRRKYAAVAGSEVFHVVSPQPHTDDVHPPEKKPTTTIAAIGGRGEKANSNQQHSRSTPQVWNGSILTLRTAYAHSELKKFQTYAKQGLTPWLIEAPLNSDEPLEAVLKPSQPFQLYKTRLVSQPPPITDTPPKPIKKDNWSEMDAFWHEAGYRFKV
ncbi:hypothetical protein CIB48_g11358 [Xylaria polymorpha]|nr:hypothetical protein CIB48_g11358 [Xylaria polymorpha]